MSDTKIVTIGNWGYRDIIMSWWLNIKENIPELLDKVVVIIWEEELQKYLKTHIPQMTIHFSVYHPGKTLRNSIAFKEEGWDAVTRFKLKAIWEFISTGFNVIYLDPDVVLFTDIRQDFEERSQGKVLIQEGKPFCSGVVYAPVCEAALTAFNPNQWNDWGSDDEKYLIQFFKRPRDPKKKDWSNDIVVLPMNEYPNGLFEEKLWSKDIDDIKPRITSKAKLLHFNYLSGIEKKQWHITNFGYWKKPLRVVNVPSYMQPILGDVCMEKRRTKYPAHQKGYQIETYFHHYLQSALSKEVIISEYDYIPIYWTAIAVQNDPKIRSKTKEWIKNFIHKNYEKKCFTIVQHCKGIEGTLGIEFPINWKIFGTSDPNAAKDIVHTQEKEILVAPTSNNLPVGKLRLLNNPQPAIGIGRQPYKTNTYNRLNQHNLHQRKKMYVAKHLRFNTSCHSTIPLLCSPHLTTPIKETGRRKYLASFIGNLNIHPMRKTMEKQLSKYKNIIIRDGKYTDGSDTDTFENLMRHSTFALCPRGFGNTSFRLIEAMEYGSIPVYISDVHSLPFDDVIDWNMCCVQIQENQISVVYDTLKTLNDDETKLIKMQQYIHEVYNKYFTYDTCSKHIIDIINGGDSQNGNYV